MQSIIFPAMNPIGFRRLLCFSWGVVLIFALLGTAHNAAWAQSDRATKAKEKEAKKACLTASQYARGIDILAELYVDTNNPTYIYNQGRCYQQNEMHEKALGRFQEYERKSLNLSDKDLADLKKRIDECEARIAKLSPPVPTQAQPEPKTSEAAPVVQPELMVSDVPPPVSEPAKDGRGLRIAGAILSSVGILGLGTGVTFNYLYNQKGEEKGGDPELVAGEVESQVNRYRLFSWIGYGAGAAAIATGVTLFILGSRSHAVDSAQEPKVSFLPTISGQSATLTLRGSF